MATQRELWIQAMSNVAADHHALIAREYDRLCREHGVEVPQASLPDMKTFARNWILQDLKLVGPTAYPRTIMCIKEVRTRYGLGLKESKDIVDEVRDQLRVEGLIT